MRDRALAPRALGLPQPGRHRRAGRGADSRGGGLHGILWLMHASPVLWHRPAGAASDGTAPVSKGSISRGRFIEQSIGRNMMAAQGDGSDFRGQGI